MEELTGILVSLEFASPFYFWLGGALILFLIFLPVFRKSRYLRFDLGYWQKKVKLGSKKTWIIPVLIAVISILISAALANPQIIEKRSIPLQEKPVMVLIDVSGSMSMVSRETESFSAFKKATEIYYDFIKRDLGATIGLLIYSDEDDSYIARDFAQKLEYLEDTLENEKEIQEISGGTNTASALWNTRKFFSEKVQAKDRTIILISDLIDNPNWVSAEMKEVLKDNINLYVIVVDENPQMAYGRIQILQNQIGGNKAKMIWIDDKEGFNQICEEIRKMESSFTGEIEILSQRSLVPFLLPVILGLIVFCMILSETVFRKIP